MFSTDHSGREPTCYGILGEQEREKSWKMPHSKNVKFQDLLKWAYFLIFNIFVFLSMTSLKTIQIQNVWGVLKNSGNFENSGNLQQDAYMFDQQKCPMLTKKFFQRKREWNINKQTWTSISYIFLLLPFTCHTSLHTNFFMNPKR